jgi:predicted nuclease of predicted toxin-antitoxin system
VKLLFEQNLSHRLIAELSVIFPRSSHVRLEGLATATDTSIWEFAQVNDYMIVSKDSDFHQRSLTSGPPPKVLKIQRGNCTTDQIINMLRTHADDIERFAADSETAFLELS